MLDVQIDPPVARVTLDRPEVHNAFNDVLARELVKAFEELGKRADVRVIVLAGKGKSFCAGGDLKWMQQAADYTFDENIDDAKMTAKMFGTIASCPKPVIARIHGPALAGGAGLAACADIAIALESATFGFTEVRLGIVPGVISTFVIKRIGPGRALELFTTGERFHAELAQSIGLVAQVVSDVDELDAAIDSKIRLFLAAAPGAIAETKRLISAVTSRSTEEAIDYAARALARARTSDEGQEGMHAFLEGREPWWVQS